MKKYLYTHRMCQDEEFIWIFEYFTRGLYRVNKKNLFIESILPPEGIYKENVYEIQCLIEWNDQIIMIPLNIHKNWTMVYKKSGAANGFSPIDRSMDCIGAVRLKNHIICIPSRIRDPIAIVDMRIPKCTDYIYFHSFQKEAKNAVGEIWDMTCDGYRIFFLVRDTVFAGMVDGVRLNIIKLNLDNPIAAGAFFKEKWWVVTADGDKLYCFDLFGNCLEQYFLDSRFYCIRLIVMGRYIFLLPEEGSAIQVFDTILKKFTKINEGICKLPEAVYILPYWDYYCVDNQMIFLPYSYPCTSVNLDTLQVNYKEIAFSEEFVKDYYWKHYGYSRLLGKQTFFYEDIKTSAKSFVEFSINSKKMRGIDENDVGKRIWNEM